MIIQIRNRTLYLVIAAVILILAGGGYVGWSQLQCDPDNPPEGYVMLTDDDFSELVATLYWYHYNLEMCHAQLGQLGGEIPQAEEF